MTRLRLQSWLLWSLLAMLSATTLHAHESLEHYVQFTLRSTFNAGHLDTELQAAFNGERALQERSTIDANANGRLEPMEVAAYLMAFEESWRERFHLELDQRSLHLLALYDPELNLAGDHSVSPHPLELRFSCFAEFDATATPRQLTLSNSLYEDTPAIVLWEVFGSGTPQQRFLGRRQETLPLDEFAPVRTAELRLRLRE